MNDEFFTQALQGNRYLKAIQLINRFETELEHELKRFGDQIVEVTPDQFETGVEGRWNNRRSSGSVIAFARVDYDLDRVSSADDDAADLTLNLSFRWVEPGEYGHADVDGALTLLSYNALVKYIVGRALSCDLWTTEKQTQLASDYDVTG